CGKKTERMLAYKPMQDRFDMRLCTVEAISSHRMFGWCYDIETESDRFDVSGIRSHNCRTRVMANVYDPERQVTCGRGNLSFTSINLPRLAIESKGSVETFFQKLDGMMDLVIRQLLHRLEIQSARRVANYPFLMGEGVWLDSSKLDWNDTVGEVLRHGTLTVGFIGLAECLVALIGKHHGESAEAQELGLKIVGHMRRRLDEESKARTLNFTLIATPAEGLSGRFVRKDKERYGEIPGVTDREYYTNSFHIPVYYPIKAFKKIDLEAPYHDLTNAGHITYVEMDGDTCRNLEAFETVIRYMHDKGIGYGSINHPLDRAPVCGYVGVINDVCPRCGRHDGEGISEEKLAELRRRFPSVPRPHYGRNRETESSNDN
ncbi:MAG: anaerobic ribonucleoside triphosphate reductase, partial [Desulfovibrio sp.]|nr:anaerobic ribonucleoside triphosphate reductase [Desulfovibrio sp.]